MPNTGSAERGLSLEEPYVLYPVFLNLLNTPVLVVGGGQVAARKVASLLQAQADVTVVSPSFHPRLFRAGGRTTCGTADDKRLKHAAGGTPAVRLKLIRRKFLASDLKGKRLVFAATDDAKLNTEIAQRAKIAGIFVNVAAPPESGDLQVPASVRRGPFCIAISTGGASAFLARAWREKLERMIGPEWGELATLLEPRRKRVLVEVRNDRLRSRLLEKLGNPRWAKVIRQRGAQRTGKAMDRLIERASGASS